MSLACALNRPARQQPWTMPELRAAIPQPLANRGQWKLTASGGKNIGNAVDGDTETRFDTNEFQKPGMWLQIELPQETRVSSILLDTTLSGRGLPARLQGGALLRRPSVERPRRDRQGHWPADRDCLPSSTGEVRANHTDRLC
jgi:hypothetical protein